MSMECETVRGDGVLGRWVAGNAAAAEEARFEEHLLTCERCQEDVRLAVAARGALAPDGTPAPEARRRVVWGAGAVLAAAGLALALLVPTLRVDGGWEELGQVAVAPIYLGVPVRDEGGADQAVEAAMAEYARENWEEAASRLEEAARRVEAAAGAEDALPAHFFLGAARLMLGQDSEAAAAFGHVIAAGPSPYLAEAHYYRAKALLREGRPGAALEALRAAASGDAPPEVTGPAAALADSVEARLRR